MLADNFGYWNLPCYNNGIRGYKTRRIDQIANEGPIILGNPILKFSDPDLKMKADSLINTNFSKKSEQEKAHWSGRRLYLSIVQTLKDWQY